MENGSAISLGLLFLLSGPGRGMYSLSTHLSAGSVNTRGFFSPSFASVGVLAWSLGLQA